MAILRRTKIVATLGPATDREGVLEKTLAAGVDLVRLNFSHGTTENHAKRVEQVRAYAAKLAIEVAILADLQGPKIRISKFRENKIVLEDGQAFILDANLESGAGDNKRVGIDYKELPHDVEPNDILLLDDGRVELQVEKVVGACIHCIVVVGGELSNNKGINRQGGGLSAKALTEKDKRDLQTAVGLGVDYIAISFPRNAEDVQEARALVDAAGGKQGIVAKIERIEAVNNLEEIIKASAAIMIARGDLGVEIGDAELPGVQKHIIKRCRAFDKLVITATQMMETMIENSIPTRAEVFDVANAVLDGTDAVMLSAETASGRHPEKVVSAMARICLGAERQHELRIDVNRGDYQFQRADEAIAMATMYTANHLNIAGIIALTESGSTPLWMSRIQSGIAIFALCRSSDVRRRMKLFRGVYPIPFDVTLYGRDAINNAAAKCVENLGLIKPGELVILTKGDVMGVGGGANALKILEVGKVA